MIFRYYAALEHFEGTQAALAFLGRIGERAPGTRSKSIALGVGVLPKVVFCQTHSHAAAPATQERPGTVGPAAPYAGTPT